MAYANLDPLAANIDYGPRDASGPVGFGPPVLPGPFDFITNPGGPVVPGPLDYGVNVAPSDEPPNFLY